MKLFYFANIILTNKLFVNNCGESGITFSNLRTVRTRAASHPLTNFFVIDKLCGESGIISSAVADFDGLRLEPRFSSLSSFITLRRERDSNPRYSYPYVSLANWWF